MALLIELNMIVKKFSPRYLRQCWIMLKLVDGGIKIKIPFLFFSSLPAVSNPTLQCGIRCIYLTSEWCTGGRGSGCGLLHRPAGLRPLHTETGAQLQGGPGLPLCSFPHQGVVLAAQLLQRWTHLLRQEAHGVQHVQAGGAWALQLRESRRRVGLGRSAAEVRPLWIIRRPAPADFSGWVSDLQGWRGVASDR